MMTVWLTEGVDVAERGVKVCHSPRGRTDHTLPEGSHLGTSLQPSTAFGSSPNLTWYDLKWAHNQEIQPDLNCPLLTWSTEHTGPLKLDRGHVWSPWDGSQAQQVGDRSQWPLTHTNKINFATMCMDPWKNGVILITFSILVSYIKISLALNY